MRIIRLSKANEIYFQQKAKDYGYSIEEYINLVLAKISDIYNHKKKTLFKQDGEK